MKRIKYMNISPIRGTASDVGGIASATSNRNTVRERSTVTPADNRNIGREKYCNTCRQ